MIHDFPNKEVPRRLVIPATLFILQFIGGSTDVLKQRIIIATAKIRWMLAVFQNIRDSMRFSRYKTQCKFIIRKVMTYFKIMVFNYQFLITMIQPLTTSRYFVTITFSTVHCFVIPSHLGVSNSSQEFVSPDLNNLVDSYSCTNVTIQSTTIEPKNSKHTRPQTTFTKE